MRIDYKNKEMIERKIYVHDSVFMGFNYDYNNQKILLKLTDNYEMKNHEFSFHNVYFTEIQSCDSWGKSPHVFELTLLSENNIIFTKLNERVRSEHYPSSRLEGLERLVVIEFLLTSGDTLIIACEYIDILETPYQENKE